MVSHTRHRMDAPAHLLQNSYTLDVLPISGSPAGLWWWTCPPSPLAASSPLLRAQNGVLRWLHLSTPAAKKSGARRYFDDDFPFPTRQLPSISSPAAQGRGRPAGVDTPSSSSLPGPQGPAPWRLVIIENLCLKKVVGRQGDSCSTPIFPERRQQPVRAIS